ncbi:hypothetical protein F3K36_31145 [Delftia sp. BR1]|nr:hypothetical protein F3K36_31145 [Delftia sp. BR1]
MNYAITLLTAASCLLGSSTHAQAVSPMEFEMQATMLAPKGVVTSCGISFNGAAIKPGTTLEADQIAGSVAIHVDAPSMVKAGHQITSMESGKMVTRMVGDQVAWIRIEGGTPLAPLNGKIVPGDAPPYHLFSVDAASAITAIASILAGKTIWVGFTEKGASSRIFSGRMKKDAAVAQQVANCIKELTGKLSSQR